MPALLEGVAQELPSPEASVTASPGLPPSVTPSPVSSPKSASGLPTQRVLRAVRATGPIRIDGRLDEPDWKEAPAATDFRQQDPDEGAPASEPTEVRVLFDNRYLYVGVRAYDAEPSRINARELTRDAGFENDDKIEILLDTYHDRRNAFRFAVNPLGTQQDALITDEGRTINKSWDAPWLSEGRIDSNGYTVEIAIPLTVLRFNEGQKTWGFNVARIIRRKNEESLWTSWQRTFGLERVSQAGVLTGVEEIRRRRLYEVRPYATLESRKNVPVAGSRFSSGLPTRVGLEVAKIGITPSLTSEFTVNPDFGQAEVDQQVVNLTRFNVFFPEKRDFFLENAGYFLFGEEEFNQMFFTRRVGLTTGGQPIPLSYGAKVTGRVGAYTVGAMHVQSRPVGDSGSDAFVPRENFSVVRIKKDILDRSWIGTMFVQRQGGNPNAYNRTGGVDAQFSLSNYWTVNGNFMGSDTPGVRSNFLSGHLDSTYETDLYRLIGAYDNIGRNFNPEVGFVERVGVRHLFGQATLTVRPRLLPWVRRFEFQTEYSYYSDPDGHLQTRQQELTWGTVFQDGGHLVFRPMENVTDAPTQPFEIHPGVVIPPGLYHFNRTRVSYSSDPSKPVYFEFRYKWGPYYSGSLTEVSGGVKWRPDSHLLVDLSHSHNDVRLPQGNFTTNLFIGRVVYNFTRQLLSAILMQVNSAAQITDVNTRLRWLYAPNSNVFLIFNQSTGQGLDRASRSLQLKMTYDLNL